ncbi:MAG: ABC transporter permease [Gammaproteobacteria bacterium]|nr:ABC transporter permease [Gammaproteobacteria bacterium]
MSEHSTSTRVTIIEPRSGWLTLDLGDIWNYRDLLFLLIWRDISVRYRQSVLGIGWAIFRPLVSTLIFTLVFSLLVRVETEVPYPVFAFTAMIPWLYFSTALSSVTSSVAGQQGVLTKVYFPRLILPLAALGAGLVEVLIQLLIFVLFMLYYDILPTFRMLALPGFILLALLTALGFGIWLTALNVKYRDVGMAVPFLVQIWMYLCPIVYPITLVPERFKTLYSLNPMVGVIEGFRWSLLGTASPDWSAIGISAAAMLAILVSGLYYFRRAESWFADVI